MHNAVDGAMPPTAKAEHHTVGMCVCSACFSKSEFSILINANCKMWIYPDSRLISDGIYTFIVHSVCSFVSPLSGYAQQKRVFEDSEIWTQQGASKMAVLRRRHHTIVEFTNMEITYLFLNVRLRAAIIVLRCPARNEDNQHLVYYWSTEFENARLRRFLQTSLSRWSLRAQSLI